MKNRITALIGAAALAAAMLPTSVFAYWTGGYEVIVDGQSIGIVESEAKVASMVAVINDRLAAAYGAEEMIEPDIQFRAKLVASERLIDDRTLHNGIAAVSDKMTEALLVTIDGHETLCVEDEQALADTLQLVTERLGVEGAVSGIVEIVGCLTELAPEAEIYSAEEAAEYFVSAGLLKVKSEVTGIFEKEYVPEAEKVEDSELYEGVTETIEPGRAGVEEITEVVCYLNGEYSQTKQTSVITDYGKPAKLAVGTKPRPAGVGTGSFAMPASGKLTSNYGARWGRMHNGIDIGAPVGTPVYASDDGVVTCSEYKNSFGNIVKIDHGNGYETYYAHNSELLVSVGQTVEKGELIAKVGSTGNSTGPHCHFEIHYKDEILNPMNYLK